jgi:hypothetical protein
MKPKRKSIDPELDFSRAARDEGINRVVAHTPEEFKIKVRQAAFQLAKIPRLFTAEDIRKITGDPPNHYKAMGGLVFGLVTSGLIKKVGFTQARRTSSHACLLQTYVGAQWDIY